MGIPSAESSFAIDKVLACILYPCILQARSLRLFPSVHTPFAMNEFLERSKWVFRDTTFAGQPHVGADPQHEGEGGGHRSPAVIMPVVEEVTLFFKYAPLS